MALSLLKDEEIIMQMKKSNSFHIWTFAGLFLWIIGAFVALLYFWRYNFYITNKRAVFQHGFIFLTEDEIRFEKIESVQTQGGLGYTALILKGSGGHEIKVKWLANAKQLKDSIYESIESKKV